MSLNKPFGLALILSVGWHLFWGLFFDLSLEEKQVCSDKQSVSVYYAGKSPIAKYTAMHEVGITSSVLPPPSLPKTDILRPPLPSKNLPQTEDEILSQRTKELNEYKMEIVFKEDLEPTIYRKPLPDWVLPEESIKQKEEIINWETGKREVVQSYYPPLPEWAKEAKIISKVTIQFTVSANGEVKEAQVEKSSGETRLDILATNYLRRWKFVPSDKNEESKGSIIINFDTN